MAQLYPICHLLTSHWLVMAPNIVNYAASTFTSLPDALMAATPGQWLLAMSDCHWLPISNAG
jgi:hypothetical protein